MIKLLTNRISDGVTEALDGLPVGGSVVFDISNIKRNTFMITTQRYQQKNNVVLCRKRHGDKFWVTRIK